MDFWNEKMNSVDKIAVCSRSFSKNPTLRSELLNAYSNVTFNDAGRQLKGEELLEFLGGHDKAIVALEPMDDFVLSRLPQLKVVSKYGVGLDGIDIESMHKHGKFLGWTGGVNKRSVSELTLAFILLMLRNLPNNNREVTSGIWRQNIGGMLSGRTVGIIGCGNIGKDLIEILRPFNCKVLVNDIREYREFYENNMITSTSLDELLRISDIVTLHVPLDKTTEMMIGASELKIMKSTAILINVARGGLVDELALKNAIQEGNIAGAAFDVFAEEPPLDQELIKLPNFFATSHIGGSASEAILAMGRAAIAGLDVNKIPEKILC